MKKLNFGGFCLIQFLFCGNILFGQKIDSSNNRRFFLNSSLSSYQTFQLAQESGFNKKQSFEFYNSFYGIALSTGLYNFHKVKKKTISIKSIEFSMGYFLNPQKYGSSGSEVSVLPKRKFIFSSVPILLKFNFLSKSENTYFLAFGRDIYVPIILGEINDYGNLNQFAYKSEEYLRSFHIETGVTKKVNKVFYSNIGLICQIFPKVENLASHGINYYTANPFCIYFGVSINISLSVFNPSINYEN